MKSALFIFGNPLFKAYLVFIISALGLLSCGSSGGRFVLLPPDKTHIQFENSIMDNDSINVFDLANIYNGGGVGVGDFNNDGLPDLYFTGNMVSDKLYLNKGNMEFEDVTDRSNTGGEGKWNRGVSVIDINNDGLMDIYICATAKRSPLQRKNILYINQGIDKDGIPHFKDMAAEYGLADTSQNTMAYFFDYDHDGDLDVFIGVNYVIKDEYANNFRKRNLNGEHPSTCRLYRNDWNDSLKHPVFTDVSRQAGILIEGYTHAADIFDANNDGWPDILVTNDFISNNVLYINNHDGTFTDRVGEYFKHTAANSMGSDAVDINNDGLEDVVEVDMAPQDNYRKKMFQSPNSYQMYQNSDLFGYQYQYARNMLQVNQGPSLGQQDSIRHPVFSDLGFFAGMAETDWSWTPLVADFDNDGNKDILFTNGFPKDITDHDFMAFRRSAAKLVTKKEMLGEVPVVKIPNYMYRNNGGLSFTDNTKKWGLGEPTFSNGAVYVDLDNDGDLDIVINNINGPASIYENKINNGPDKPHFLGIKFDGTSKNRNGIGAKAELHYDHGMQQVCTNMPFRGYISSVEAGVHFGLANITSIDSVVVIWPGGAMQLLRNVKTDQVLRVNARDAKEEFPYPSGMIAKNTLFKEITDSVNIHYQQQELDYIDFNIQKLLPHKFSEYGPALAVGDVDGNGLDDIICGGSSYYSAQLFLQQPDGRFIQRPLLTGEETKLKKCDDLGVLLFDADGDGDLDLYIAGGGYEYDHNSDAYRDKLFINDGKGNFTLDSLALPANFTSKFCVRAADYNHDGKLDLFVSGRVDPWNYPKPVSSFIYRNDSKNGHVKFTDVTNIVAKDLINIGMVCDALWTDFDNDGWPDLILAGEFMPVTFLRNDRGVFKNVTATTGIGDQTGWWNSIIAGDFDNDGDIDYVVGNLGQNSFYKASDQFPVRVYGKDFDSNGVYDMIPSLYLPDPDGNKQEYPAQTRDDLLKQMTSMRRKFPSYRSYALATMDQVLTAEQRKDALILKANNFQTSLLRNDGNGKFTMIPLPSQAQFSTINGMVAEDFDGDGNLDIVMNGNDYGTDVGVGRYDALNGLFLKGDGKGNFTGRSILQSGIFIPGNGKALVELKSAAGRCLLAAGQNRGPLKIFALKNGFRPIPIHPSDVSAIIRYKSGRRRKTEFYYGESFLSQSARFLGWDEQMLSVEITDDQGHRRIIKND